MSFLQLFEDFGVEGEHFVLIDGFLVHTVDDVDDLEEGQLLVAGQPFPAVNHG